MARCTIGLAAADGQSVSWVFSEIRLKKSGVRIRNSGFTIKDTVF
jgi:hypothetical protein